MKPAKGRNCYLFMRSRNREWLAYKAAELKEFSSQRPFTEEGNTLRWHSNCYPIFNDFRELFYKDGTKTITMEQLDQLRDIGLAIWYGDCGKVKGRTIWLNTHKFGEEGSRVVVQYFNEVGVKCSLAQERKNYRVAMTEAGSQRFLATIAHQLPEFMLGKLK